MELISRTINNRPTFVRPQATVLQACEAAGVDVPRFCYHEKLSVSGNCRRCLVEIQKSPKPVVSCARPVAKGRVVFTDTPLVRKAREAVLEFLLINHPLDCPICDQGGECDLQDEALTYGSDRGRFFEFKRSVEDKECGPIVKTIRTRCIHCTRCVRFSTEVAGNEVRGAFGRGEDMEIGTYIHTFLRTELSGNLVDLCPVGALTSKPYAYQARSWELQRVDTIDFFDALCSDISVHTRKRTTPRPVSQKGRKDHSYRTAQEEILRVLPRHNGLYSENWIADRTRYAFDGLNQSRLVQPRIRETGGSVVPKNWIDVLTNLAYRLLPSNNSAFSFVMGSQTNLESRYSVTSFSKRLGFNSIFQSYAPAQLNADIPFFYSFNRTVQSLSEKPRSNVILINTNLRYEASLINTVLRREQNRRAAMYISVGVFNTLRYQHKHEGNSSRILVASLENRVPFFKSELVSTNGVSLTGSSFGIFVGVESLRSALGAFFQKASRLLGKRFFIKTANDDRLGYVHSSVGSLAFAYQGNLSCNNDSAAFNAATTLFTFGQAPITKSFYTRYIKGDSRIKNVVSFDTHIESVSSWNAPLSESEKNSRITQENFYLPITSLYERTGHLRVFEGQRRKHFKALTNVSERRNPEVIFSALGRKQGLFQWFSWTESLSMFYEEYPKASLLENTPSNFAFNPFDFESNTYCISKLAPFHQTIRDFYLQEPIAANSSVMGECSLFLGGESNFVREVLFVYGFYFCETSYIYTHF